MNRKWLAALIVVLGLKWDGLAAPAPATPFQFVVMGTKDTTNFNPNLDSYAGVATSGTNFVVVGAGSIASFAGTHAPLAGGYLTNFSAWTANNVANGYGLKAVTYGAGLFVAGGTKDTVFTTAGNAWSSPIAGGSGNSVNIEGLAFSGGPSNHFASVTASYVAAWAAASAANWNAVSGVRPAIVESFRGVTAIGGNGLALCGLGGDVRISPDAGQTWNQTKIFDFEQPVLNAIASDGANTLVVAGVRGDGVGLIEVSTNAGGTWVTNLTTSATLYGAAYTGSADNHFLVVGSGGTILIATNTSTLGGTNANQWTAFASGTASDLHGAAVATSGPFQGTILAVGNSGAIVVGGTLPQAPYNSGVVLNNLLTYPPQVLGVATNIVVLDNMHPTNSIAIDWYDAKTSGNLLASNTLTFTPTNTLCGSNITYWAQARDIRTGFISTTRTPFVYNLLPLPPTGAIVGVTNVLTLSPQTNQPVTVEVITNSANPPGNFAVKWFADPLAVTSLNNGTETNLGNVFYHTPTNFYLSGSYTIYAETVAINTDPANTNVVNTNLTPVTFVIIPPAPTNAIVGLTNVLTTNNPVWVQLLVNSNNPASNFSVNWYQDALGQVLITNSGSSGSDYFYYTPTNVVSGSYTVWAQTVATTTTPAGLNLVSTNLEPVRFTVIPPAPFNPVGATNWATAPGVPNSGNPAISVSVLNNTFNPAGEITADWYANANGVGTPLSGGSGTLSYTPTDTVAGTYTYYAQARDVTSGLKSTNLTAVTFVVFPLPAAPVPVPASSAFTLSLLTAPLQTNPTLTAGVASWNFAPGATVTVDWFTDAGGVNLASTATNNADANWFAGGGVVGATNTLSFIPSNVLAGTNYFWARARVVNPGFTNNIGISSSLTEFAYVLVPPAPGTNGLVVTNLLTAPSQTNQPLWVEVLTNAANPATNFTVSWYQDAQGTELLTNSGASGGNAFYYTPTNGLAGSYTYWAQTIATTTSPTGENVASTNLTPVTFSIIPPAPTNAIVGLTNVLSEPFQPLWVQVLVNAFNPAANFTVYWCQDALGQVLITNSGTDGSDFFYYTPTNVVSGNYTVWAQTVATNTTPAGLNLVSTNLEPVTFTVIPPAPFNPVGATNWATAQGVPNSGNPPISVSVLTDPFNPAGNITADWYASPNAQIPLVGGIGTLTYTPADTTPGTYIYYAQARDVATGLTSTNLTAVTFVVFPLPAAPVPDPASSAFTVNLLTAPLQTNATLTANVSSWNFAPGATVTVDWFTDAGGVNLAYSATNNADGNWFTGGGLVGATNTLTFIPSNGLAGTNYFWARARVVNPGFPNNIGISASLTEFTYVLVPPAPGTNGLVVTNLLTAPSQINQPLWVEVLTNAANPATNFTVSWYQDAQGRELLTNSSASGGNAFYYTPTNVLAGSYTYWAQTFATTTSPTGENVASTNLTPVTFVIIPPAPTNAIVGLTNVLSEPFQPLWVQVLVNAFNPAANFTVNWCQDALGKVLITNSGMIGSDYFYYTPTNVASGSYTVWAQTVATNTTPAGLIMLSTNLEPVTFTVIPPAPFNPVGATNWATAQGVPNSGNPAISVSVLTDPFNPAGNITADWYASPNGGTPLPGGIGTLSYTPADTTPGNYVYYAQARDVATGLTSTNLTAVTFVVFPLPAAPLPGPASSAFTLDLLTAPLQTNTTLTASVAVWDFAPGATVTVDWFTDAGGVNLAYSATNNADANWFTGGGVVGATNTLTFIPSNVLAGTNYFWARARVVNPGFANNIGISPSLTEFAYVLVPPAPATIGLVVTNVLTAPGQTNQALWVGVLTNAANPATNFTVSWYQDAQGTELITNSSADGGIYFNYTPTNALAGSHTYWAQTIATNTSPAGVNVRSTNLTPVVFVLVPPAPTNSGGNQINCAGVANPALVVSLPFAIPGAVINWYSDPAGTQLLPNGADTESYTPTNTLAGVYTFYAQTVANNYASTNLAAVTLELQSCTNAPVVTVFGQPATNVVSWYGNLLLESTTNLAPPIYWITNSTGLPGQINYWTNSTVAVPIEFYRLYAPTN